MGGSRGGPPPDRPARADRGGRSPPLPPEVSGAPFSGGEKHILRCLTGSRRPKIGRNSSERTLRTTENSPPSASLEGSLVPRPPEIVPRWSDMLGWTDLCPERSAPRDDSNGDGESYA